MKKRILAMVTALLAAVALAGDGSGLNPQFLKWRKMKAAGMLPAQKKEYRAQARAREEAKKNISLTAAKGGSMVGVDDQPAGLAPDVKSFSYLADIVGAKAWSPVNGYPRRFDLRENGAVTGVRNQGDFETCWAFAAMGSLESAVLVQKPEGYSYTANDIDFSERHMVDNHGFDLTAKQGGNMLMAMAYLLRWGGPVSETDSPYPAPGTTEWSKSSAIADPRLHVQQVRWIPGKTTYTGNDEIKNAVMNYGGVYTTFYMDKNTYYNSSTHSYRCPLSMQSNHGVLIVGWDDDYPASNFGNIALDNLFIGNGAYLVKNSWGSEWGDDGYFWVSYYDRNFAVSAMAVFSGNESKSNYKTIYQYDELGYTGESFKPGDSRQNAGWMANVFTATADDQIAAVGFYVLAPNTSYQIRVYTDIPEGGTPKDGTLKNSNTQTGEFNYAGYVTIPLDKVVPVKAGTRFAVCVHLSCKGSDVKPLAYEAPVDGYSTLACATNGQSFYSSSASASKWVDLNTLDKYRGANFCLKAYGYGDGEEPPPPPPADLEITGPAVVAAGATADYEVITVFDDNSRYPLSVDDCEILSGDSAVQSLTCDDNIVHLTVCDSLDEDTRIVIKFTVYDGDNDRTIEKSIAITATKALPAVPTDFVATTGTVEAGVRMSWTEVANAASYSIYRSETADSKNAIFLASVEGGKYTDLTADPGKDYYYFIKAVNSSGSSAFTEGQLGWRKLAAPENLVASDGDFDYVQLTWDAAEGANYYRVYRAEDMDAEGNPVDPVEVSEWIDQLAFRDTPPVKDKVYFYWVKSALSWTGHRASDYSIFDQGNRMAPITLSSVMIQGNATVSAGSTTTYTLLAELSNGTRIERATNVTWSVSGGVGHTALPDGGFEIEALVNDALVASNTMVAVSAEWTFSNEDGSVTKSDSKVIVIAPVIPKKPNAVKISGSTTEGVVLEWYAVEGASSYNLYRGESVETAQLLVSTSDLTYSDATLIPGTTYRYWLEAVNCAGASEKSDPSADVMRQFTPPIYVSASNGTSISNVVVSWRAVIGANYYRVSRAETPDGEKHDISGWLDRRTFEDVTAAPGVTYWYFVEAAFDAEGGSGSAYSVGTIGKKSADQTLTFIEIDGPSSIQYDTQGSYVCTATYANGMQKKVTPVWSFKAAHPLVTVSSSGIVSAGHVTGDDLHLELQATYTDNGITKTDSFAVTIIALKVSDIQPQVFISNVVVRARWPWNGLVDISYDLYSVPATTRAVVTVAGYDHDLNRALQAITLFGDGVEYPAAGGAPHQDCRVVWNLGADYTNFHASAFSVSLDAAPFAVAAPVDFRASDGTSTNGVELAWEEAFGAQYYEIFRSLTNNREDADLIASVTNATEFLDATTEHSERYYYWIRTIAGEFKEDVSEDAGPVSGTRLKPPSIKPAVNLVDGLVAYYPFNGNLDDASGNNHHLAFATGDDPVSCEARADSAGTAYAFAGATQLNATTNLSSVLTGSFTFSAWVRTGFEQVLRSEQRVGFNTGCNFLVHPVKVDAENTASYGISVAANGVNVFEYGGVYLPAVVRYPASLGDGWHHVAFTVDESGAPILYVDGVFAKSGISTGRVKWLYTGENIGGGEFGKFTGEADDICYYDRALDAEEVAALHDAGSPLVESKPVSTAPVVNVAYDSGVATVTITCHEEGADENVQPTVYYSIIRTDGGDTVEAREYTVPFSVEGHAVVIAWSEKEGYYNSPRVKVEIKSGWKQTAHDVLADTDTNGEVDFDTFGDSDWVFDPDNSSDEVNGSMRSGPIGGNGTSSMTAKVSGVGAFAFDWKVSSEAEFDFLSVTVDGEFAHKISGEVDWTQMVIDLTNDTDHVITWTYCKDASVDRGQDCGWVDFVTWAPEGTAVDSPLAMVTPIDGGASNEVTIACTKVPSAVIEYKLVIFGEECEWRIYEGPFVVEGDGEIYMRAKKPGYIDSFVSKDVIRRPWIIRANEALLMDEVTKNAVTLSPDYFEYGFEEEYWWDQDRSTVSDGTWASMQSPKLGDSEAASIYASVTGPGTLYFDRKVDSEAGWDVLTYYAGEEEFDYSYAEAISGDKDWERVKLVFRTQYNHVIEWEYDKDDRGKNGRDCGWIDFLKWIPARFAPAVPDPRIGYVFGGFATNENGQVVYDAGTQLDAEDMNETFIPVWSPITYKLRYAAQAENEDVETTATLTYDQPYTLLAADNFVFKRGYAFGGWATNENGSVAFADGANVMNLAAEQDAEVVLTPVVGAVGYTVKFFDGVYLSDKDVAATYDVEFAIPGVMERDGYTFDGWAHSVDGDVGYTAGQMVKNLADTQDAVVRLYARWTQLQLAETMGEAVEQPTFEFELSGNAEWFVQTNVVKEGKSALQSGAISGNESTSVSTTLVTDGRKRVSFWWKVSSEPSWDTLKFFVNGKAKGSISGYEGDWERFSAIIPAGTNTLTWTYAKDGTGDRGEDCGWVDYLVIEDMGDVDTSGDIHVAVTGNDTTGDGTEENPFRTVQRGVDQAEKGMTVIVHPGTYEENVKMTEGINLIAIDGPLVTCIKGVSSNRWPVIFIDEGADDAKVWGFALTNGRGHVENWNIYGGAMDVHARAEIRDCIMHDNGEASMTFAGAVRACGATTYAVFENCLFYNNTAWAFGGASLVEGQATMVFSHCTAASNSGGSVGGFGVSNTGTLIVTNSISWGNSRKAVGNYMDRTAVMKIGNSSIEGGASANGVAYYTDLGGNITTDPEYFTVSGVPYQSNLRATKDMGFSLDHIQKWGEDEGDDPVVEPTEEPVFKLIQYCINKQPYTIDDALAATNMPTIWKGEPVVETYTKINFRDNMSKSQNFQSSAVQWPATIRDGKKSDYFVCQITGKINIPETGNWTFACGSDDGFRCIMTDEDGKEYSFEYYKDRSYDTTLKTFNFTKAGTYSFYLIYFEYVDASALDVSCAKGSYSKFNSSAFKLIGTPESRVTLVGGSNN